MRYFDWNSGRLGYLAFLDITDYEKIKQSNKIFARKFYEEYSQEFKKKDNKQWKNNNMKEEKTAEIFTSSCFWDLDRKNLNLNNSRNYIINRVLSNGNMNDIKLLFNYYGWETIKKEVVKIRYLNDKILNWLSSLLKINKKKFRCYNNKGIF